jgi:uncharacterized protein (UPF0332 family)
MEERTLSDYVNYKRQRAFTSLDDVQKMLDNNIISSAMSRIYYAGFYIAGALLLFDSFSTSKHRQLIGDFNKEYIKTGKVPAETGSVLDEAYQKRIVDDYLDFSDLSKDQIEYYFNRMKEFVKLIDDMITERIKTIK